MNSTIARSRLEACWREQFCYQCVHSPHGCGWCAASNACVPVSSLLDPLSNKHVCPTRDERWDLRTRTLGCSCSTATFLSVLVAVVATLLAFVLLCALAMVIVKLVRFGVSNWRGVELEVNEDGTRSERPWKRPSKWQLPSFATVFGSNKSEQENVTERSRLLQ